MGIKTLFDIIKIKSSSRVNLALKKFATAQKLLDETEVERDQLLGEMTGAKERADDRHQQAQSLMERESDLLTSVEKLTNQNTELRHEIESLKNAEQNSSQELEKLKSVQNGFREISSKFEDLQSTSSKKIDELQWNLESTRKELEQAGNRTRALEKQNSSMKKELRSALKRTDEGGMTRSQSGQSIDSLGVNNLSTQGQSPAGSKVGSPKHSRPSSKNQLSNLQSFTDDYGLANIDKNEIIHKLVETQKLNVKEWLRSC